MKCSEAESMRRGYTARAAHGECSSAALALPHFLMTVVGDFVLVLLESAERCVALL